MKSNLNLLRLVFLFLAIPAFAQKGKTETVFITSSEPRKKVKEKKDGFVPFTQLTFSITLKATPDNDFNNDPNHKISISDYVLPNGIGAHFGYGIFYNSWIGVSANTGIDFVGRQKLVSAPIYGTLTLIPFPKQESGLLLQVGLGHTFALGRGNLSGTYQKYRLGFIFNNRFSINLEANFYGFPIYEFKEAGSFSVGISLLDFIKK